MTVTTRVLDLKRPANALALWLALNQPTLFLWAYRRVKRARLRAGLGSRFGLGALEQTFDVLDDDADDADEFDDVDSDSDEDELFAGQEDDTSAADDLLTGDEDDTGAAESPEQILGLDTAPLSEAQLDPTLLTPDTDSGAATLEAAGDATADDGTTVSGAAVASGESTLSALGAVGSALASPAALSSLAGAAAGYFLTAGNAAGAGTTAAQLATVASGSSPLPLTTVTAADGSTSPALLGTAADGSATVTPLSEGELAALTPSSASVFLSEYGVYVTGFGAAAILLILASRKRRAHR